MPEAGRGVFEHFLNPRLARFLSSTKGEKEKMKPPIRFEKVSAEFELLDGSTLPDSLVEGTKLAVFSEKFGENSFGEFVETYCGIVRGENLAWEILPKLYLRKWISRKHPERIACFQCEERGVLSEKGEKLGGSECRHFHKSVEDWAEECSWHKGERDKLEKFRRDGIISGKK